MISDQSLKSRQIDIDINNIFRNRPTIVIIILLKTHVYHKVLQ